MEGPQITPPLYKEALMTSPANSEQHFFGTEKVWKILLKIAPPVPGSAALRCCGSPC